MTGVLGQLSDGGNVNNYPHYTYNGWTTSNQIDNDNMAPIGFNQKLIRFNLHILSKKI